MKALVAVCIAGGDPAASERGRAVATVLESDVVPRNQGLVGGMQEADSDIGHNTHERGVDRNHQIQGQNILIYETQDSK